MFPSAEPAPNGRPRARFASNHAGGVLGGISTGQNLVNTAGQPVEVLTKGRHDPCVGIRATPILEALLALVLMEHALRHRARAAA